MSDPTPDTTPATTPEPASVSEEFFLRVNDFLQMANRIERRYDTQHAQTVMVHAFSRYSAHHFRTTSKTDTFDERAAFANYIGNIVAKQLMNNLEQMSGPPASAEDAGEAKAE